MTRTVRAFIGALLALVCASGYAQFNSGQVLTATQLNSALASPTITGGTINGSVIGGTNPNAGTFTSLSAGAGVFTGQVSVGGAAGAEALRAVTTASAVNWVQVQGNITGNGASVSAAGSDANVNLNLSSKGTNGIGFYTGSLTRAQMSIVDTPSAVNYLQVTGAPTNNGVTISAQGSDTNVNLNANAKGTGAVVMNTGGGTQAVVSNTAGATRYLTLTGSNGGNPTIGASAGRVAITPGLDASPIGAATPSTGAFTTLAASGAINANGRLFVTDTTGQPTTLGVTSTGANGANILLAGNGSTTPNKSIRANGGNLQFCNSAYSACPVTITDAGNISSVGGIDNTAVGSTTPGTGAFTTLSSTGTTGLGTPTSVGTSVFPTIVAPVSTTATSTNGSTSITVASATGIAVGMGIYAGFVNECSTPSAAYSKAYVTAVSGTTITMNCPATSSSGGAVQFGQQRYSTTSSVIASDVGTQTLKVGSASQGNSAAWLNQVSAGQDFRLTSAAQIVSPPTGGYALTLGARSSDATSGAAAFPLQSFLYLDTWGNTGYAAENVYLQDNLAAATAGQGPHIQMEQSINSLWGAPPGEDPFNINATNQTIAHRYDCGTGQSTTTGLNGCTTAIDIVPNPQTFQNGIVIGNGALDTGGGTRQANVISMPLMTGFTWYSAASTYSVAMYSPSAGVLNFIEPSGGQYNFIINGGTALNITSTGLNGTAIGQTTAAAGSFTTLSASGLITPSTTAGIKGTAAADNANAGSVGEFVNSTFSSVNMTTSGTAQNLTSISLTAGDWDVTGAATYTSGSGATQTIWIAGVNTTSATLPSLGNYFQSGGSITATGAATAIPPVTRINVSSTTTVYLIGESVFSGGSVSAAGFLRARRVR